MIILLSVAMIMLLMETHHHHAGYLQNSRRMNMMRVFDVMVHDASYVFPPANEMRRVKSVPTNIDPNRKRNM